MAVHRFFEKKELRVKTELMKRFYFLHLVAWVAICLMSMYEVKAQPQECRLKGVIMEEESDEAIPYATVALSKGEKNIYAMAASENGTFDLRLRQGGKYKLKVVMIGYGDYETDVEIPAKGLSLPPIRLHQGVKMEDVVVAVKKPLVVTDAEKLTYSVEDDPQAAGSALEDIIRKVPQLSIDGEGNILLNGQSNYKVLQNGHASAALENNLKDIIQSIPAEQISRIEVITNPSMKYDAEGVGGIINFITSKKKNQFGYNGSLSTSVGVSKNPTRYSGNGSFSMQSGKFAMGINAYVYKGGRDKFSTSQQENFNSEDSRYQYKNNESNYIWKGGGVGFDMSYQPDTMNLLTMEAWYWMGKSTGNSMMEFIHENHLHQPQDKFIQKSDNNDKYQGGEISFNYEHQFNREGHALTISDNVEFSPMSSRQVFDYQKPTQQYVKRQLAEPKTVGNTFQIDYTNPLTKHHTIEAGLKHIFRRNIVPSDSWIQHQGAQEPQRDDYSYMRYYQHVLAVYLGYGLSFDKWSGRVGVRMERTWNRATAEDQDHPRYKFHNRQFNAVPYFSLTYNPKPGHSLSFSYTERLNRPSIYSLNSARVEISPYEYRQGNPNLEAAINHALNLKYSRYSAKWSLMLSAYTYLSNNTIDWFVKTDEQGIVTSSPSNDVRTRNYGYTVALSWRPSVKFSISLSSDGYYVDSDLNSQGIHNDRFTHRHNVNTDFALWKDARFVAGASYDSGTGSLIGYEESSYRYYFGLRQKFLKKRLELNIMASNPFTNTMTSSSHELTPTHIKSSEAWYYSRRFRFALTWRFGAKGVRVKQTAKTIVNDDIEKQNNAAEGQAGM